MTPDHQLLILSRGWRQYARLIEDLALPGLGVHACNSAGGARSFVDKCDILLAEPPLAAPLLDAAGRLAWFQSTFAGVDALTGPSMRTDYLLTGVKDVFGPQMSEYVMAYILAMERHLFQTYEQQKSRIWKLIAHRPLRGRRVGICGIGSIGRCIARAARHFGMPVNGYRRTAKPVPEVDRTFHGDGFYEFLGAADYVVAVLPHTPETHQIFDENAFAAMSSDGVLINVGRGATISEAALVKALEQGVIRGAVLDVFEEEPLPPQSPLWSLPNAVITPHCSAYSFPEDIAAIFADNYRRFLAGEPLKYRIDFAKGY